MKVIATGLTGHLGGILKVSNNLIYYDVPKESSRDSKFMKFNLNSIELKDDYFIHAAWDLNSRTKESCEEINVKGSLDLIQELENLEYDFKKFIFISTINADERSKSVYEKCKFRIEEIVLSKGGYVIKPGIVFDSSEPFASGFIKNLYDLALKYPILPNFSGEKKLYYLTSSVKLNETINKIVKNELSQQSKLKIYNFGPLNYKELVNDFMDLNKKIFNLPWIFGYIISKFFEILNINFPIKSDSLLALR